MTIANDNSKVEAGRIDLPNGDELIVFRSEYGPQIAFSTRRGGQMYLIESPFSHLTAARLAEMLQGALP